MEENFAGVGKISIFENMACKGLPKVRWGSNKDSAINSLRNGVDSDIEPIKNDFKDPKEGGIVSNSVVPVNLDIRGECSFARVQL